MKGKVLSIVAVALTMFAIAVFFIWANGMLSNWRETANRQLYTWLLRYALAIGLTFITYWFARAMILIGLKSKLPPTWWLYVRWVLMAGVASYFYGAYAHTTNLARTVTAIEGFVTLAAIGLVGTRSGIIEAGRRLKE